MVKAKFTNRITVGFTDEQFDFLCDSVKQGMAEDIASLIRKLVTTCAQTVRKEENK